MKQTTTAMLTSMTTKSLTAADDELLETTSMSLELSLLPALSRSFSFSFFSFFFGWAGDLPFLSVAKKNQSYFPAITHTHTYTHVFVSKKLLVQIPTCTMY